MKRSLIYAALAASAVCLSSAQSIVGDWRGMIGVEPAPRAHIAIHITRFDSSGSAASVDFFPGSGDYFEMGIPATSVSLKDDRVRVELESGSYYQGTISADGRHIYGFFWSHDPSPGDLTRVTASDKGEEMSFEPSSIDGAWRGWLDKYPEKQPLHFRFITTGDGLSATIEGLGGAQAVRTTKLLLQPSSILQPSRIEMQFKSIEAQCWGEFDESRSTFKGSCSTTRNYPVALRRVLPNVQPAQTEFEDALDSGELAFTHNDFAEAVKYYEKAAALQPGSVEAHRQLGRAYWRVCTPGDPKTAPMLEKAEAKFRKVLDLDPGDKLALASLALMNFTRSGEAGQDSVARRGQARLWLNKLAAADPENPVVLVRRRQLAALSEDEVAFQGSFRLRVLRNPFLPQIRDIDGKSHILLIECCIVCS
jgi:tetratricopeptide (TPR) repeat protein